MRPILKLTNVSKSFGKKRVLRNMSFHANEGEILAFVGPNGCGKSTLFGIISNLIAADSGKVHLGCERHEISYMFQNYHNSLFPWLTCENNISFPLKLKKHAREHISRKLQTLESYFSFAVDFNKYPHQLSGGQQQIVAFLRALVTQPKLLLIDEPFSALDLENNMKMRKSLLDYHSDYKPTILFVTHHVDEAVHLADRVLVLSIVPTSIASIVENKYEGRHLDSFLHSDHFAKTRSSILHAIG